MSPRLPALLDVLDRADATEALNREQLLKAAQDLGTSHSPTTLATAVDAHLAAVPPEVEPPVTAVAWGWNRPETLAARAQVLVATERLAWVDTAEGQQRRRRWWEGVGIGLGVVIGALAGGKLGLFLGLQQGHDQSDLAFLLGLLGAVAVGALGWFGADQGFDRCRYRAFQRRQAYLPFTDELFYRESVYLEFPITRNYLKAMLTSAMPEMMEGDAFELDRLAILAVQQQKQERAQEQHAAELKRQAERQANQAHRLNRFARALNGETKAIPEEPTQEVGLGD